MSIETTNPSLVPPPPDPIPPLRQGDRLTRAEFERRYDAMPNLKKAELIEGVVYMPSPVTVSHSKSHFDFIGWMAIYRMFTPGVEGGDNGSLRLDLNNMPQPDAFLRILEECGGQARISPDRYVEGSPEVIGEVAVSRIDFDLNIKLPVYRRNGVREYIVWRVPDQAIDWFILRGAGYDRLPLGANGIFRSEVLPGLWLDRKALIEGDLARVGQVAQLGVASTEHADFVRILEQEAARRK
jgi:hypothetical protein